MGRQTSPGCGGPMRSRTVAILLASVLFALSIACLPTAAAVHAEVAVLAGNNHSVTLHLDKGQTLVVGWDSTVIMDFEIRDADNLPVRNELDVKSGGTIIQAEKSGDYKLIWHNIGSLDANLRYDYYTDTEGLVGMVLMLMAISAVAIVLVLVVIAYLVFFKRKAPPQLPPQEP